MNVQFVAANPRERARPLLDTVLANGIDQVCIACAFVTGGGATILGRHKQNLSKPDSFLVAAWEPPTDPAALGVLHTALPGKVFIHLGAKTPVEKGVGPGLMHSKVFFARRGNRAWLWVGSHNLTASASQGVNLEAAALLEGTVDEAPFQAALAHLYQCKNEAVPFDPLTLPPLTDAEPILVVHAEQHVSPLVATPWFVHLRPTTTKYDDVMRPKTGVWLYLYPPGSLVPGKSRPKAQAAFSGSITALNFTDHHPGLSGIPADWQSANYVIEQRGSIFALSTRSPHTTTPTQCVFRIESRADAETIWLSRNPKPREIKEVDDPRIGPVDPDLREYFTKQSISGENLIYRNYRALRRSIVVQGKEIGSEPIENLRTKFGVSEDTAVTVVEPSDDDPFSFIYRARYRR